MKFYTEEEILDKHIGKRGTPKREQFEADIEKDVREYLEKQRS